MPRNDILRQDVDEIHEAIESEEISIKIRPFRYDESDYEALVAIENAIEPDIPRTAEFWQHWDSSRDSKYYWERCVAERNNEIVAIGDVGQTYWSDEPGKYFVYVSVYPEYQRQGIGSNLYDHLLQHLASQEPRKLVSGTRENRETAVQFLKARGFRPIMRYQLSRLESVAFDPARFRDKVEKVLSAGIAIKTLSQLRREDPNWKQQLYELAWESSQDMPSSAPRARPTFEEFENRTLKRPTLLPDAYFVAVDGDQYVGQSTLYRNLATDRLLETGLTGVVRSHRRRGIATALKVYAIEYAQRHGNAAIQTNNEETNPMYQLNIRLGFVPEPAQIEFAKELED